MPRRGYDRGTTFSYPLRTSRKPTGATRELSEIMQGQNPRLTCDCMWDFTGNAANYLIGNSGTLTAITSGTPTGAAQVANTANGEASFTLANSNEVEFSGVSWADELQIPASREFYLEAYFKMPALALSSVEDIVVGLTTAFNATLASTSKYVWMRMNGSNIVTVEGKDGTTTNLAQATSPVTTLSVSTYVLFTIDATRGPGNIQFFIDDNKVASLSQAAFAATDVLQPLVGIRKQSGTTTTILTLDFLRCFWSRV